MPGSKLMATGGVENTLENLTEWYQAGVCCVGMGSTLLTGSLIKAGDFKSLTENVTKAVEYAYQCRQ